VDRKIKNKYLRTDIIPADTHKDAYIKQREIWFAKTPGERFAAGLQMTDDLKAIAFAGIRRRNPGMPDSDVKIEWFKLMYKNDFQEEELNTIIEKMRLYDKSRNEPEHH